MQAMGLVNDHIDDCHVRAEIEARPQALTVPVDLPRHPQRDRRLDAGGAARRQPRRQQDRRRQRQRHRREQPGVDADAVERAGQARARQRPRASGPTIRPVPPTRARFAATACRSTSRGRAPSASRTPISCVRRPTEYEDQRVDAKARQQQRRAANTHHLAEEILLPRREAPQLGHRHHLKTGTSARCAAARRAPARPAPSGEPLRAHQKRHRARPLIA